MKIVLLMLSMTLNVILLVALVLILDKYKR